MLELNTTDDDTTPPATDLLERLQDQLHDLLIIAHQAAYSDPQSVSTYLHGFQYVSGVKSAERSYMRFTVKLSPSEEAGHAAEETLTLELSVRRPSC